MFGYSHLPFSTSDTAFFNGEVFTFTLNVGINNSVDLNLEQSISFVLNIERDRVIIL